MIEYPPPPPEKGVICLCLHLIICKACFVFEENKTSIANDQMETQTNHSLMMTLVQMVSFLLSLTFIVVLSTAFPELKLEPPSKSRKLHVPYRGYWKDITNQRRFLDTMAIKLSI